MDPIKIHDKKFRISYPEAEILKHVQAVADRINKDMKDKNPLFLAVLNGSFVFAADLMRLITIPCEISFVKLASYQGTMSTGKIKEVIGINEDISGRTVIILEDIVESGLTMKRMIDSLGTRNPESVHICTLLLKPEKLKVNLNIEYAAMERSAARMPTPSTTSSSATDSTTTSRDATCATYILWWKSKTNNIK